MNRPGAISHKLSEFGYRMTPQRSMIVRAVEETDGHISAEEIHAQICAHYPQMNISTVYRTLDLLKGLGLVTETDLGDGRVRYHSMGKGHHHHLVCERCGNTIDIKESTLNPLWSEILRKYGFKVNMKHLAFFGRCPNCQR